MSSPASLFTTVALVFIVITIPSIFAFRWSSRSTPNRFWPAVILSLVTVLLSFIALKRIHFTASRTVNGRLQWHFDSQWVFLAALVIGVIALVYSIYKKQRTSDRTLTGS